MAQGKESGGPSRSDRGDKRLSDVMAAREVLGQHWWLREVESRVTHRSLTRGADEVPVKRIKVATDWEKRDQF